MNVLFVCIESGVDINFCGGLWYGLYTPSLSAVPFSALLMLGSVVYVRVGPYVAADRHYRSLLLSTGHRPGAQYSQQHRILCCHLRVNCPTGQWRTTRELSTRWRHRPEMLDVWRTRSGEGVEKRMTELIASGRQSNQWSLLMVVFGGLLMGCTDVEPELLTNYGCNENTSD